METTKLLLVLALFSATAAADQKELPPPGGSPRPFVIPAKEAYTLKNGMKVTLVPYGTMPVVSVAARIAFGNANESADQVWLADALVAMMKEGTVSKTAEQLAQDAARMGGQLQVGAMADDSFVSIDVLSEFAPDAVQLVADVARNPRLPASEFERIRANLIRRVAVDLSTPQAQADQAFNAILYGDHPYGRLYPTEARLRSYTLDAIRTFYRGNVGARRTHLFVVGRFDPAVKKTIAAAFESWESGPEVARKPLKAEATKSFKLIDRPGAEQSTLRIGQRVAANPASPDYITFQLLNNILGGSFGSRITSNIREQKGYTYSPVSSFSTRYHTAHWVELADVTTAVTADSIREILFETNRLRTEPVPEAELQGMKNYMSGIFVLQNSSNAGIIGQLAFADLQGLSDEYLKAYIQKVNAVSSAELKRVAETYLDPANMTLVVVGDKAKIEESLKSYQSPAP
jgi:predicted Zn-dependent peptidase